MDRKGFLKTGLVAAATALTPTASGGKQKTIEQVGFNHLPPLSSKTMNTVLHRAETRGHANHGWLDTNHTFSFAHYYNPERMNFGVLRVLNDDIVDGGMGFGTHPHDNMEIISIPLSGDLEHKDSMGNVAVIRENDIQIMSAGTGVYHSEYNKNKDSKVNFLQIWVFPKSRNIEPRYDQKTFKPADRVNRFQNIVSPDGGEGVQINQNAWFHLGKFEKDYSTSYAIRRSGNGVYAFVLDGEITINGQALKKRDGFGIWNTDKIEIQANNAAELLLMDVPMN